MLEFRGGAPQAPSAKEYGPCAVGRRLSGLHPCVKPGLTRKGVGLVNSAVRLRLRVLQPFTLAARGIPPRQTKGTVLQRKRETGALDCRFFLVGRLKTGTRTRADAHVAAAQVV